MAIQALAGTGEQVIEDQARWVASQGFERVLDIGGAEKPLRAATHVLDIVPYAGRRVDQGRGLPPERFTSETWIEGDCNVLPWSWPAGFFDYVWASQLVEDIRDPIAVCKEMMRVGKAGFISTVQRSYESSVVQGDGVVGYHHHRWLVELERGCLTFVFKSPILQVVPKFRPPYSVGWLLHFVWEGSFEVREKFVGGDLGQRQELALYLSQVRWR